MISISIQLSSGFGDCFQVSLHLEDRMRNLKMRRPLDAISSTFNPATYMIFLPYPYPSN
jgi:hypothetical protein